MRNPVQTALGLLCCLCVTGADLAQLRQLEDGKRVFELRTALEQTKGDDGEILYFRAMMAARFGHEAIGIEQLRKFLGTSPSRELTRRTHEELASAMARVGRYGNAASELGEALALTPPDDPGRPDNEDTRLVYEALRDAAPQIIEFQPEVPVRAQHNVLGSWNVPVNVNGKEGNWIFDTGANFSTISESEAMRMGLAISGSGYSNGSTGKRIPLRVAVAGDLRFGAAHLRNVAFAVLTDDALHLGREQIRGALGLPVLRALGSVGISAKGVVRIESTGKSAGGEPNMFFDELSPVVEVHRGMNTLQMLLDTGSNSTYLYPSFRSALDHQEIARLREKRVGFSGAGETITSTAEVVRILHLQLPGKAVKLRNIRFGKQPVGSLRDEDGVIGMDALAGGFTLDLKAMQLRLE